MFSLVLYFVFFVIKGYKVVFVVFFSFLCCFLGFYCDLP
ncbi:putative membrane protein [Escherichia coli 1-176-05_S1_C3]|nr:putative membrane protein [Escherichia coli 1-176-05_S1_C1]EZK06955.1 putative membrane protein [Escherichia coli 1-176-05_S1_C3]